MLDLVPPIYYNGCIPKERSQEKVSPRTGRPIVGDEPKKTRVSLRVTKTTAEKFQECAEIKEKTQVSLFEEMVDDLHDRLTKK